MRVYIASRFRTKVAVRELATKLIEAGHDVVSSWHKPGGDIDQTADQIKRNSDDPQYARRVALRDLEEIRRAHYVVGYTDDCMFTPGGLWYELGYATALHKMVGIIGPRVNVFCHLHTQYRDIDHFVRIISGVEAEHHAGSYEVGSGR